MRKTLLALSGAQHARLQAHLLPQDGREAAAILLCAPGMTEGHLVVRDMALVPHDECLAREPDAIVWPGMRLADALARAEDDGLGLILIHSHPGGFFAFSETDDASDEAVMPTLFAGWCGATAPQFGSAIMVPGGAIRARTYTAEGTRRDIGSVRVAGDEILHFTPVEDDPKPLPMAFSDGMAIELRDRRACIIGVSGTGSIVAEQVARLGFGGIVLIDFDHVERKNLNRILNSTLADADAKRRKVHMFAQAISGYRAKVDVVPIAETILSREAVEAAATCDVIFSCVDSSEGRQIADLIAQAFLIPLIDMGVSIPTRRTPQGAPAVADVVGRIDYVQPGRSSLASRAVFTAASLRAEYLAREAPDAYDAEVNEGYIKGAPQEAPAVIALNMRAASTAVLEYLARAFPYRHEPNDRYARTIFRLGEGEEETSPEGEFDAAANYLVGTGSAEPLLGLPSLDR